jgi:PAS domain S-box-containing protein
MGLIEFDFIENRVSYINPKLLEITGYTKDEVFDEKAVIEIIHSEDLENLIKPSEGLHVEFRIYTKDQKLRWLSGIRSNQYDKEGKIIKTILWLWDATERREIEEIKSDLLTRFSHEFKTPLISIMGFTELLMSTCEDKMDKKALSFLNNIKNGSERLNTLVNTFIESSHLDKDFSKLELGRVNLLTLIEKALREVKGVAILRNHLIDISVDEKLMVEIDKDRIYTVLTNLILNAIKYTPIGGTILIRSKIEQDFIVTSISDNGIGITSSEKEKLFERFGKIERYGHGWDIITDGIGMGLYISKKIITEHGGKIWVESQGRNRGSTFNFTIPIRKN